MLLIIKALVIFTFSCGRSLTGDIINPTIMDDKYTNDLINESSPYLLQHAHNPVNWYPWGKKALDKAKRENKMLIISIGYSACHWCHVMEHESYSDPAVADKMNDHFICIKVDREERPDIDQIYMNAAYLVHGSGGWPLNVLALPDGRPFFAGTYYPKDSWMEVLDYFIWQYNNSPDTLINQATLLTEGISASEGIEPSSGKGISTMVDFDDIYNFLQPYIDFKNGGMKQAVKFPMPSVWEYLMHYYAISNNHDVNRAVMSTLDKMAAGGIYDHLGGGFSRYSTDDRWHIPHFEKMLYDNAQMVTLYSHAWQLTKKALYKDIAYHTIEFIEKELTSPDGGFYSSIDADSEGEEGKFYVWTLEEVTSVLKSDAPIFNDYFNVTGPGNWEKGKNILIKSKSFDVLAERYSINRCDLNNRMEKIRKVMLEARSKRVRPQTDDKILTSWNAIMLKGYTDAFRSFGDKKFLDAAIKNADFLFSHAINENGEVKRNLKRGSTDVSGLLDDYSFTISAFIGLYQATFDEKWLARADKLTKYVLLHFSDDTSGLFYFTPDNHPGLIARKMELTDTVIPSSNSEMALNLLKLGHFFENEDYILRATEMINNVRGNLLKNIYSYSNWGQLEILISKPLYEVAIVGADWQNKKRIMDKYYLPDVIFYGGTEEGSLELLKHKVVPGKTIIYVCRNKTCNNPVTDPRDALKQIEYHDR
jgi:uncharacterized protein YyaL (SSP411 family)